MAKIKNPLHTIRELEVELALEAAWEAGFAQREAILRKNTAWVASQRTDAGVEVERPTDPRKSAFDANLKVLEAAAKAASSAGQTVDALARLVDNMGRLS